MLQEKSTLKEKKIDTEELVKVLSKLSEEEKTKIFYMIKGIELVSEPKKVMMAAGM